jgi:hypothetical protein
VQRAWHWAQPSAWIRWFTDGERRYGKELWKLASVYLPSHFTSDAYPYRKVWREGLEVAIKIKGSMSPLQANHAIEVSTAMRQDLWHVVFSPLCP